MQANALLGNYWEERRGEDSVLLTIETSTFRNVLEFLQVGKKLIICHRLIISDSRGCSRSSQIGHFEFTIHSVLEDPKLQFDCRSSSNGGDQSREWDIATDKSGWGIQVRGIPRQERGGTRVMEGWSFSFGHHHRHSCSLRSPALRYGCLRLARRYVMTTTTSSTSIQTPRKPSLPQSAFCSDRCLSLVVVYHSRLDLFITSSSGIRFSACYFEGHQVLFAVLYSIITTFFLGTNKFL